MNKTFVIAVGVIIWLSACTKPTPTHTNKLASRLDSLITQEHDANRFDGTIVVGTQDSILFTKAIGIADRVWDIPLQLDHRFDICSLDKSFAAALVLLAVEEGKLSLDDRLRELLGSFSYTGTFHPDITLHHLLTHTSGLGHYEQLPADYQIDWARPFKRKHVTPEEYVDFISTLSTVGPPGAQFAYSSFGYHLVAIILEETYQMTYGELLEEKICQPLGLNQTFSTTNNREVHQHLVEAYNYDQTTGSYRRNQFIDYTLGRRTFSTAQDLYQWGKAMSSSALLSEASRKRMQSNHLAGITADLSYGYGWAVFDGQGNYQMGDLGIDRKYIIHGGATEGFRSMLVNIEEGQYIIAFMTNIGDRVNEIGLTKSIVNILLESEHED